MRIGVDGLQLEELVEQELKNPDSKIIVLDEEQRKAVDEGWACEIWADGYKRDDVTLIMITGDEEEDDG